MDKTVILNDLKRYLNFKKDSDFADFLGIKQNTLSMWKSRNTFDIELLFNKCENINPEWLLTGKGQMLKGDDSDDGFNDEDIGVMNDFFERLDSYIKFKGLNDNKITVEAGISNGLIGKARKRGSLSQDNISKILETYSDLDANWLFTGVGSMIKGNESAQMSEYSRMPSIITIPEKDSEKENIEIVPVKLAAGYVGGGYAKENFIRNLPKFRLPYLNNGTFRCFGVGGYSMSNGIQDEDWFVGKFVDNMLSFSEGKIHAVIAPSIESLLIKRVFRHPLKADYLVLRSDNNDTFNTFPDIEIHIKNITELWSYSGLISFKEPNYDILKLREILALDLHKVTLD